MENLKLKILTEKESQIKKHIYKIGSFYNSKYDDRFWRIPNAIIVKVMKRMPSTGVIDSYYSNDGLSKTWVLVGLFVNQKTLKHRVLWVLIKAQAAGSVGNPFDQYDVVVQTETLSPKTLSGKSAEYIEALLSQL